MIAIRKRMATYEIGGKSRRPTLIASQVELRDNAECQPRGWNAPVDLLRRFRISGKHWADIRGAQLARKAPLILCPANRDCEALIRMR